MVKGCIHGRGTKTAVSTLTTWPENMFNVMDFVTPSVKVTSALNSEKAPSRDSKALCEQERKLLEALAEKFRATRKVADEVDLPGAGPGSKIQGRRG